MGYHLRLLGSIVYASNHHAMLPLDLESNPPTPSNLNAFLLCSDQQWANKMQQCGWEASTLDSELKPHSPSLFTGQSLDKFLLPFGTLAAVVKVLVVVLLSYDSASLVVRHTCLVLIHPLPTYAIDY